MQDLGRLSFTCPTCKEVSQVTTENIIVHIYSAQPYYNTVEFRCECGEQWHLFGMNELVFDSDWEGYCIEVKQYAPKETVIGFAKVFFNNALPKAKEEIVDYFCNLLEQIASPDDIDWSSDGQSGQD